MNTKNVLQKSFMFLTAMLLCICLAGTAAFAAAAPEKVTGLKTATGSAGIKLTWDKADGASGYNIYMIDPVTNEKTLAKVIKGGAKTSAVISDVKEGAVYRFSVSAYRGGGDTAIEGKQSQYKAAKAAKLTPAKVNLKLGMNRNKAVKIKWGKAARATGYQIYQMNAAGKFVKIGTTKKLFAVVRKLKNEKIYYFKVRAINKKGKKTYYGKFSNIIKGKPYVVKKSPAKSVRSFSIKATAAETFTAGGQTFTAGSAVTVTDASTSTYTIQLKNGKTAKISGSKVKLNSLVTNSKKAYNRKVAEEYVNRKGFVSRSKYLIWISLYTQNVYVFEGSQYNWKLIKRYLAASGLVETRTPRGITAICKKTPRYIFDEWSFSYYATYWSGGMAIHSEMYWLHNPSQATPGQPLGQPLTHGCIRILKPNALWIYENVPIGTLCVRY